MSRRWFTMPARGQRASSGFRAPEANDSRALHFRLEAGMAPASSSFCVFAPGRSASESNPVEFLGQAGGNGVSAAGGDIGVGAGGEVGLLESAGGPGQGGVAASELDGQRVQRVETRRVMGRDATGRANPLTSPRSHPAKSTRPGPGRPTARRPRDRSEE